MDKFLDLFSPKIGESENDINLEPLSDTLLGSSILKGIITGNDILGAPTYTQGLLTEKDSLGSYLGNYKPSDWITSYSPANLSVNAADEHKVTKLAKGTIIHTAFSDYELVEQIGQGGNGRVFSAKNKSDELFAVKFIERDKSNAKLKRFKNEIHFCENHSHKNIVKILDRGYAFLNEKDYVFYVMPLYESTLKKKMESGLLPDDAINIFIGILEGLNYAHKHETIHRDIKPENILFAKDSMEPVICDFGIAHFAEEDLLTIIETKATDRMANFQYSAPEQRHRGGNVCYQTDIYALALILNEMFTSEIPQAAGHKTIKDVNPDYAYLDDVFSQLYKQNPEERLYPEDKILSELKLLTEKHQKDKSKKQLENAVEEIIKPEKFETSIIGYEYERGSLIFVFDKILPKDWVKTITLGSFSYSFTMGYDRNKLRNRADNKLYMPIRGNESESTIKTITSYMKEWVKSANMSYSDEIERKAEAEQAEKERIRKAEIEKLEKDNAMMSIIQNLD